MRTPTDGSKRCMRYQVLVLLSLSLSVSVITPSVLSPKSLGPSSAPLPVTVSTSPFPSYLHSHAIFCPSTLLSAAQGCFYFTPLIQCIGVL